MSFRETQVLVSGFTHEINLNLFNSPTYIPQYLIAICVNFYFIDVLSIQSNEESKQNISSFKFSSIEDFDISSMSTIAMHLHQVLQLYKSKDYRFAKYLSHMLAINIQTYIESNFQESSYPSNSPMVNYQLWLSCSFYVYANIYRGEKLWTNADLYFNKAIEICNKYYIEDETNDEVARSKMKRFKDHYRRCLITFGCAHISQKHFKKALQILRKCYALDDTNIKCWAYIAHCLAKLKQIQKCKQWMKEKLDCEHNNQALFYYEYALTLRKSLKDYKNAEYYYLKCLETDPKFTNLNGSYAFLLYLMERYEESLKYLKISLTVDMNNSYVFYCYGLLMGNEKYCDFNYFACIEMYKKCLMIDAINIDCCYDFCKFILSGNVNYSDMIADVLHRNREYVRCILVDGSLLYPKVVENDEITLALLIEQGLFQMFAVIDIFGNGILQEFVVEVDGNEDDDVFDSMVDLLLVPILALNYERKCMQLMEKCWKTAIKLEYVVRGESLEECKQKSQILKDDLWYYYLSVL